MGIGHFEQGGGLENTVVHPRSGASGPFFAGHATGCRIRTAVAFSALIGAWLAGTLGGGHCLAMCGGFVAAMAGTPAGTKVQVSPLRPARAVAWHLLPYNGGRVTTYVLLGAMAGGTGALALSAADVLPLQRVLYVLANLFLLALAVAIAWKQGAMAWLQRAGGALFGNLLPAFRPLLLSNTLPARYALGMLWGLVPCALTYSVLPIALFAGGIWQGAAVMLAFGLGTLPNLLAAGWVAARARRWLEAPLVRFSAAALLAGFAAAGIWRALFGTASLAQGPFCL
jgi:sulfite exporter TauE/SafE